MPRHFLDSQKRRDFDQRYPDYPAYGGEFLEDSTGDEDLNRQWWEKPAVTMSLNKCQMGVLLVP